MKRRQFLKMSGAMSAAAVVTGCGSDNDDNNLPIEPVDPPVEPPKPVGEQMNWSACLVNCGSNCPVKVYSDEVNGQRVITRIETDHAVEDEFGNHEVRACLRGRSLRQRVYAPDRLRHPLKRVGPRGSNQFVKISWDEALDTVASELNRLRSEHGPESTHFTYNSGAGYHFSGKQCLFRLMNIMGGYLGTYGDYSWAQLYKAADYTFGSGSLGWKGSSNAEMKNSDYVVLLGHNPSEIRMSGSGEAYDYLNMIQQKQAERAASGSKFKTVIVDPRYTDSALGKEDQWIPVRPGTDAALAEALAHELISNGWVDKTFLDTYCVGYDADTMPEGRGYQESYKAHILGEGVDGVAKTPEWAASITGVSAEVIRQFAKELHDAQAPFFHIAASLSRQASGENNLRACYMLPLLLGAVGRAGTNNGALCTGASLNAPKMPTLGNLSQVNKKISFFTWTQAIEQGRDMTVLKDGVVLPANELDENGDGKLGVDIKAIINYAGNALINQHAETVKTEEILADTSKCEFILVIDNWMTPSAKFADIILPDISWLEAEDLVNQSYSAGDTATLVQMSSSIGPMHECRDTYDICVGLATRWGVEGTFTEGKTKTQWLDEFYQTAQSGTQRFANPLPNKETMLKQGVYRQYLPDGSYIVLKDFRDDPQANPLSTPSGKIEIFSSRLQNMAETWEVAEGDVISALPKYVPTWDGYETMDSDEEREKAQKYPLQLHGYHTKGRAHSSYHNVPWLREAVDDAVWMNPLDASERGLKPGDTVHVYNDRGTIELPVKITPRIMVGVTALGQGAWLQSRTETGSNVDKGGCLNTLTSQRPTPVAKGNGQHTNRVEIRKA